jgi:transcription initiation factor TFIID subunit 8
MEISSSLKKQRDGPTSKRTHSLSHIQSLPPNTEAAPQDETFIQAQLLRSICTALAIVGYDSVKPSALEMFRAELEEYMINFLTTVKHSMTSSRRTTAIPQDFIFALAEARLESHHLDPHLRLRLPEDISNPQILPPAPAEPSPPNLAPMLGHELAATSNQQYPYIPSHFPPLPSRHAWQSTALFTQREDDPRRIRERATDEGVQAEHALRKLTAANKARLRQAPVDKAKDELWQDTISDLLADEDYTSQDADGDIRLDGVEDDDMMRGRGSLLVNHDRSHWRRGRGAVHI